MHSPSVPVRPALRTAWCPILLCVAVIPLHAQSLVVRDGGPNDFPLVVEGRAAPVWYDSADATVVGIAARDFAEDVGRVSGARPAVVSTGAPGEGTPVIVGTLGHSRLVDRLVSTHRLDVGRIAGKWESFLITTVKDPLPGVSRALVVAGSDRRGTAYGVFELSRQIGVSPWSWWADVPVRRSESLFVRAGTRVEGPPSVKYRGLFINDEDWGLQPWASMTYDPALGDIGPKTYARVFELMLRLRANILWPAMHPITKAFNLYPRDRVLADDFAIVMASSHAEPMLRDNTTEWTAPSRDYDYQRNPAGVLRYWEERVRENGRYENVWTLGMRGIHDSPMVGASTTAEKVALMERIFADQRSLLRKYVNPDVSEVPQAFTPYKEVLPLYRAGLKVPDDVTIVWPDDNFGYIREFPDSAERARSGGSGVYYHISYLGSPESYLWLNTTPPALLWEEMSKAWDLGVRREWILNVGDIKPGEIGLSLFLEMAWDHDRWRLDNIDDFLADWVERQFGAEHAHEIASLLHDYYRLSFQRKPEHLHWGTQGNFSETTSLDENEIWARVQACKDLLARVDSLAERMPAAQRDAFFELVAYPVRGMALANQRYFYTVEYLKENGHNTPLARSFAARARNAAARLDRETAFYNDTLAGGKWRRIMPTYPADDVLEAAMRHRPPTLPSANLAADHPLPDPTAPAAYAFLDTAAAVPGGRFTTVDGVAAMEAEDFTARVDRGGAGWRVVPGLGRTGAGSVAVYPVTTASVDSARLRTDAPRLDYRVDIPTAGSARVRVTLVPTFSIVPGRGLRLAVGLDDAAPHLVVLHRETDSKAWAEQVLDNAATADVDLPVPDAGSHVLHLYMVDPGVVVDRIVLDLGGSEQPGYLGPLETPVRAGAGHALP
ncbi:MAG TPA: glycosyl hydrolase 115 family protein [Longimicrobiaceae bacterium]|nr:glycosyl hydrolase 115 family protein [Longimicrobiaceae bacterium]